MPVGRVEEQALTGSQKLLTSVERKFMLYMFDYQGKLVLIV